MSSFNLKLFDSRHQQCITGVSSFVGLDATGSFGILPYHARFMTTLVFGLARFSVDTDNWQYLAVPGAVLYFNNNELSISTRHFLIDTDFDRISSLLELQCITEEDKLRATRESLGLMERAMLKRLLALKGKAA